MKIDIRQGLSKLRVVQLAMGVRDDYRMDPVEWGRIAVGGFDVAHDEVEAGFDKVPDRRARFYGVSDPVGSPVRIARCCRCAASPTG